MKGFKTLFIAGLALFLASPAWGGIKVVGTGEKTEIDSAGFPPEMAEAYKLMQVKCKKCHTLERTVVAIQTGLGPISGDIFDKGSTEAYGIKMLRKPDSEMSKPEVITVINLLNYLLEQAAK